MEPLDDGWGGIVRFWRRGGGALGVLKRGGCGGREGAGRIVASERGDAWGLLVRTREHWERGGGCRRRRWW